MGFRQQVQAKPLRLAVVAVVAIELCGFIAHAAAAAAVAVAAVASLDGSSLASKDHCEGHAPRVEMHLLTSLSA